METTEECADCPFWEPRTPAPVTTATTTLEALREALEDVYRVRATCQKAIDAFGRVQPFVNIQEDEARHIRALRALLNRRGAEAPPDSWPARTAAPETLGEACAAAGRAELQRQALYERLLQVVDDPAARRVLRLIQAQSKRRHLTAFRRCFTRALKPTGRPRGVRRGRGTE
jgi:rubrerythrin